MLIVFTLVCGAVATWYLGSMAGFFTGLTVILLAALGCAVEAQRRSHRG